MASKRVQGTSRGRKLRPESFKGSGPIFSLPAAPGSAHGSTPKSAPSPRDPDPANRRDPAAASAVATRGQQAHALRAARRRSSNPGRHRRRWEGKAAERQGTWTWVWLGSDSTLGLPERVLTPGASVSPSIKWIGPSARAFLPWQPLSEL